jgi:hypothetical protein
VTGEPVKFGQLIVTVLLRAIISQNLMARSNIDDDDGTYPEVAPLVLLT